MSTLIYKGSGQPAVTGGGLFDSLSPVGGTSPAYAGSRQPSSVSSSGILSGLLGGGTPAYRSAPVASPNVAPSPAPGDPDPFPQGPFAIVIPRQS